MDALNRLFWYFRSMSAAPVSVLVIESHPLVREALRAAIAAEPDLTLAEPVIIGEKAWQMAISTQPDTTLLTFKPDMILLSFGNSGSEDLQTLAALRRALPNTPILVLISSEVEGREQAALEAGACRVLTKTAPRAELIRTLHEMRAAKQQE